MWSYERGGSAGGGDGARRNVNLCKLITTAAAIATTVLARAASSLEVMCTHSDSYFYSIPGSRCTAYYRCYQNQPIQYSCTDGAMFDFYQQRCVRTEGTCYEAVCIGKTNGLYADTSQGCRRAYRCRGGKITTIEGPCPLGMLFDSATNACAPEDSVAVCESPETTAATIRYEADARCYGLSDGNHVLPGDSANCKKYLHCRNDQVVDVLECPPGYRFDERTQRCRLSNQGSNCRTSYQPQQLADENGCSYLPDGLHLAATSHDCRAYVKCQSRRLVSRHDCPPMTVFNGQQCVPTFLYHCPRLDPPGDICHQRHDGYHVDPRKGCAYYVRCQGQRTVEQHSCPNGFHYDPAESACIESALDTACHRVPYSPDCIQRASGYYQDLTAMDDDVSMSPCRAYFHCHNGARTSFRCPYGYLFDGENCVAQGASAYQCPVEDVNSCLRKPNGYYKDARAGCRAYHLCTNGHKISYLCEQGQIYAQGKCIARTVQGVCNEPDTPCAGRPDGYYQDRDTQCRQYYFCQRGEKLQTLTCRGSKIFDGRSCVPPDGYTCPAAGVDDVDAAASENCIVRHCHEPVCAKGGFFADYDSGCEQYFFCIDGKQSVLSCSDGYVFNGELCVPRASYYCPRYCTPPESC
uniref:Chitin-binding type-2 domain-containing protein n=1 Tax=Anopheles merus TaxID=30066 RepID=A0A182V7B1_ANOME